MALYPALDVSAADEDFVMAEVDEFAPVAVEERDGALTIFFADKQARDSARSALAHAFPHASLTTREVDDESWASRSQANLGPIRVGRVTITPPWSIPNAVLPFPNPRTPVPSHQTPAPIVIRPSMGFGTGHHPTTRLCLAALQRLDLTDAEVLDVGTGSGVLAIAACRLGARRAIGVDHDADAVQSACENVVLNGDLANVRFECADLTDWLRTNAETADVVTANLTGATLAREAPLLMSSVRPSGFVVASGLEAPERENVIRAFDGDPVWSSEEDGWVGLVFRKQTGLLGN